MYKRIPQDDVGEYDDRQVEQQARPQAKAERQETEPPIQPNTGAPETIETLRDKLERMRKDFSAVLPKEIPVDRFIRTTLTAVGLDNDLLSADINSLLESTMKAAQDGLLCDKREAALVIFNVKEKVKEPGKSFTTEKWVKKVQYMPMVKGLQKVLYQTGLISGISVHEVYEADSFTYELGDNERIEHRPFIGGTSPGPIVAAYAIFKKTDGSVQREVMQKLDIDKVRNVSKAKDGPWKGWEGEMARKAVLRRGMKYLPSTPALERVLAHDNETYAMDATPNGDKITPANSGAELSKLLEHKPAEAVPTMQTTKQKEHAHVEKN